MSIDIIVTVIISLVSSLVGFIAAWVIMLYQFQESKRQLCIDMYQEFDSADMLQSRFEAGVLLSKVRKKGSTILLEDLFENKKTRMSYMQLARVLRFWERLSVMIISKRIDVSLAKDIFAYDYKNWRDDYLRYCKTDRYQSLNRVQRLDQFLLEKTD